MEQVVTLLVVLVVVALVVVLVRPFVSVVTVHDHERGLRYRNGRLAGLADSGSHLVIRPFSDFRVLDIRPTSLVVEGQEVMTADAVAVRVSLAARYVVADPVAALTRDADYRRTLHLLLQLALRDVLAARPLDDALAARRQIGPEVREAAAGRLAGIGIELLDVEVRDLMLPGELKRAFAGVLTARKLGEAGLERARAETAALRSLANAGRLVEDNPGLLQLRILQEIGESSGNSVVFGAPDPGARVVPIRPAGETPPETPAPGTQGTQTPAEPGPPLGPGPR